MSRLPQGPIDFGAFTGAGGELSLPSTSQRTFAFDALEQATIGNGTGAAPAAEKFRIVSASRSLVDFFDIDLRPSNNFAIYNGFVAAAKSFSHDPLPLSGTLTLHGIPRGVPDLGASTTLPRAWNQFLDRREITTQDLILKGLYIGLTHARASISELPPYNPASREVCDRIYYMCGVFGRDIGCDARRGADLRNSTQVYRDELTWDWTRGYVMEQLGRMQCCIAACDMVCELGDQGATKYRDGFVRDFAGMIEIANKHQDDSMSTAGPVTEILRKHPK